MKTETSEYSLGFGHFGSGVLVWNRNEVDKETKDYKSLAHIDVDRKVKYYVSDLPKEVKNKIENFAATSTLTISATQNQPVFRTTAKD